MYGFVVCLASGCDYFGLAVPPANMADGEEREPTARRHRRSTPFADFWFAWPKRTASSRCVRCERGPSIPFLTR